MKSLIIRIAIAGVAVLGLTAAAMASFSDVSSSTGYADAIGYAEANGIVSGYADGSFKPLNRINRAEFTKIIAGAFLDYNPEQDPSGFDIYSLSGVHFSDAISGEWYVPYLRKAITAGLISGYPDGTFKPANDISFAEAAKIIMEGYGGEFAGAGYPSEQWYLKYVNVLDDRHAIPTTIRTYEQKITRAEMVEMIYRLKESITDKDSMTVEQLNLNSGVGTGGTGGGTGGTGGTGGGTGGGTSFAGSPMIGSCAIFPADNPWNKDISGDPVDPNSADYIANIGGDGSLHPDFGGNGEYGIPYNVVGADQPMVPLLNIDYADESDPGPYPIPPDAKIENGGDAHVLVVDQDACMLYELYTAEKVSGGWNAGSAAKFDLKSNALRPDGWTSADAAGLPIFPGLIRYDEVAAGAVNHAIRFTVSQTQAGYIHPATHYASSSTDANRPPMGLRLRLKADYDISGLTGDANVIATALKKYGMILADNGSDWYITGAADPRWNDDNLNQLKSIPGNAFEAVQSGQIHK